MPDFRPSPQHRAIAEEWTRFERKCFSSTAPTKQKQEMRRAFYAGVDSFLSMFLKLDARDADIVDSAVLELREFQRAIARGEA